jgi:ABC-2 type transport system ATP-binding protein
MKSAEPRGSPEEGAWEYLLEGGEGRDLRRDIFRLLAEKGWPILSLRKSGMSLEDAFLRLTAGDSSALSDLRSANLRSAVLQQGVE